MVSILSVNSNIARTKPSGPTNITYDYHYEDWLTLRDVIAGQRVIKLNKERYLPARSGMDKDDYLGYLQRAVFFGITGKTHESLLGSIFRRATTFSVPVALNYLTESATPNGEPISAFVEKVTGEALLMGRAGVLVDMPRSAGARRPESSYSLSTASVKVVRPYFVMYRTENILDWEVELDGDTNERILTKVILAEYEDEKCEKNHIRVLELVDPAELGPNPPVEAPHLFDANLGSRIYRQYVADAASPEVPLEPPSYPSRNGVPLNRIPFYFFSPAGTQESPTQSPILPIAELNISHYQSSALLESARHFVGSPQYWIKMAGGGGDQDEFLVSSNKIWKLGSEDSVGIIEYHGQGLTFLENAMTQKEQQMANLGAKLFSNQRRQAAMSSKQLETTQNSEESILLKLVNTMNYQFTKMIKVVAWWMNVSEKDIKEIVVELNKNFDPPEIDARALRAIQSLYEAGVYPVAMLYLSFKDAGMIPADMSMEEFKAMLVQKGETPNNEGPIPFQKPEPQTQPSPQVKAPSQGQPKDPNTKPASNPGDAKPDQAKK